MAEEKKEAAKAPIKYDNVSEQVLSRINQFQEEGGITLPKNYSVENTLKSAWLVLQSTKDKDGKFALDICSKDSISNALLDMVIQGLSVSKKQGYFIVYGTRLEFQRSYFGTVSLAKRAGGILNEPVANVIYEGDDFVYAMDPKTGLLEIIKHEQKVDNIDMNKIKAAYAVVHLVSGKTQVTIMTMKQIQAAWGQGATKGGSPAHRNFPDEMAKKTVIGRACKMVINSSDDSWLYDDKKDESEVDIPREGRNEVVKSANSRQLETNVDYGSSIEEATIVQENPSVPPTSEADNPY